MNGQKGACEEGDDGDDDGGGFIVVDPDFGIETEIETDSSDEEAEFMDSDDDVPLVDLLSLAGIAVATSEGDNQHAFRWRAYTEYLQLESIRHLKEMSLWRMKVLKIQLICSRPSLTMR